MSEASPTLFEIEQIVSDRRHLPVVDITLTVTRFQNLLDHSLQGSALTEHTATLAGENSGYVFLENGFDENQRPKQTIRVRKQGAILRFNVTTKKSGVTFNAIACTFACVDKKQVKSVYFNDGRQTGAYSPFSDLRLNGQTFQFTDTIIRSSEGIVVRGKSGEDLATASSKGKTRPRPKPVTYKFSVIVQRHSDGAIGIIDPYIENEGDPQAEYTG